MIEFETNDVHWLIFSNLVLKLELEFLELISIAPWPAARTVIGSAMTQCPDCVALDRIHTPWPCLQALTEQTSGFLESEQHSKKVFGKMSTFCELATTYLSILLYFTVPHIIAHGGSTIKDYSLDPSITPAYPHAGITLAAVQGQTGVYWRNGFLICGGRTSYVNTWATNVCVHGVLGGSEVEEHPMTIRRHIAKMVIAGGEPWITGGVHDTSE